MKKNSSLPQFKGLNTVNLNSPLGMNGLGGVNGSALAMNSPSGMNGHKKIQGYDMSSTTKSNTFNTKIQQLKNRPNKQSIQDQYIKGLQDQIHYLQMQLKLLQQKDQAKHGQIDQLQKFFSDGVPINQNILAIKNGFNNYKNEKQKTINQLSSQKKERQTLIQGLNKRISEMINQLEKEQKDIRQYEANKTNDIHQLLKTQAKLKRTLQLQQQQLRSIKTQNRRLSQQLTSLQRNKQIQMVMTLKNENHKLDKLSKIKQSINQKQTQFADLQKQYQQLLKQQQQKSYVLKIQQENLNLKKKAISMERQLNALQTKAKQKQMELDAQLKQRYKEISAKTQMKMRLDNQKAKINKQNSMKVEDIQKVAKEKQIYLLQKIINQNKKLSKYTQYYGNLLTKVQDQIQKMVEKKPELKSQINAYSNQVKRLIQTISSQKTRQSQLYSQIVESQSKIQNYNTITPPLMQKIEKEQQQIKIYSNQRQKLYQDIKVKQKQLELILILKSLNLQQVQMSKSSSSNIQDKLINFIRHWEQLQRNN